MQTDGTCTIEIVCYQVDIPTELRSQIKQFPKRKCKANKIDRHHRSGLPSARLKQIHISLNSNSSSSSRRVRLWHHLPPPSIPTQSSRCCGWWCADSRGHIVRWWPSCWSSVRATRTPRCNGLHSRFGMSAITVKIAITHWRR